MIIPDFSPRIAVANGFSLYQDNRVLGRVVADGDRLTIHDWVSEFPGLGHTTQALQWLREQGYTKITAMGAKLDTNAPHGDAVGYWLHMQSLGLVEKLIDDQGELIGEVQEIDEFTLRRLFDGASDNLGKISTAISKPTLPDSLASKARRRMMAYTLLDSFSKGELKSQHEPLEDTDLLYDLLDTDPDRYSAVIKSIFALANDHSERAALSLIKHTRDIGLVSIEAGWKRPLTFLYNGLTGQVMSSNGVQPLKDVAKGRAVFTYSPLDANKLAQRDSTSQDDIALFGFVAELLCEDQGIRLG